MTASSELPFTVWASAPEVLALYAASPEYWAVILRAPEDRLVVVHCATPPDNVRDAHAAITFAPSRNTTVPVGVPTPPLTVAVSVTDWLTLDGFSDDTSTVVEFAACTKVAITEQAVETGLVEYVNPAGVPPQLPLQPENVEPLLAAAVSATTVFCVTDSLQSPGHAKPLPVTLPLPSMVTVTVWGPGSMVTFCVTCAAAA